MHHFFKLLYFLDSMLTRTVIYNKATEGDTANLITHSGIAGSVAMLFFETFFSGWFPNPMIFNSEIRSLRNERGVVCREPLGSRQSTSLEWRKVSDRV